MKLISNCDFTIAKLYLTVFSIGFIGLIVPAQTNFVAGDDFEAEVITSSIPTPRGLYIDESGDILVLSRGLSSIVALYQTQNQSSWIQTLIVNGTGLDLNHGIAYNKGWLYASSGSHVYRWPYEPGQRLLVQSIQETVVYNISIAHTNLVDTRTLLFDAQDRLYVTINSDLSIDPNSSWRCRIRRFNLTNQRLPIDFETGTIFADGLRNEVGLAFDKDGILWGVENAGGPDHLIRDDLGGDIHEGNPGEELNRFDKDPGTHYGYPYCWGSYHLPGYEIGTQFAWPTAMAYGKTDAWCRIQSNNERAVFFMPAHTAPLGIEFYKDDRNSCDKVEGAFPCSAKGSAIIAYHGSMNITVPIGYKVSMYTFDPVTKVPTGHTVDIVSNDNKQDKTFRPVNAVFNHLGHLIVSADSTNEIIKVLYKHVGDGNGCTHALASFGILSLSLMCFYFY